ncbi:MFS transporter [Candidatus Parcubacteria bacterium]|nr:MFS transporter [Candidatus Parcubacteria bacterium]
MRTPQMRNLLYFGLFFYALHYALTLYIESTYLSQFFPERLLGVFFSIASVRSIIAGIYLPRFLSENGNYRAVLFFLFLEIVSLFGLAFTGNPVLVFPLFFAHQVLLSAIFISVNVLLESFSQDASTGRTRGFFLTIFNTAILLGPLAASFVFEGRGFTEVFLAAALLLIPVFFIITVKFRHYRDPLYAKVRFLTTLAAVILKRDIYRVSALRFLLEFFYSVMVIYTPLYLHNHVGIPMNDILGIIMPIVLLPFVVFPYLLGRLADLKFGEKEFILVGVAVIAVATMALSFIATQSIAVWALFLLITRIGATMIETSTDSYFFKSVSAADTNLIAFFSNLRPLAFIAGPLAGVLFLSFFDIRYIFLALGAVLSYGIVHALALRDSR